MIARLDHLRTHPDVFRHLTGLTVAAVDQLADEVVPRSGQAHRDARDRPDRRRAVGGGDAFDLATADHLLLAAVWLRQYPTNEVLGFLFGVSDSTASRTRGRVLPHLGRAGKDTMRVPDPATRRPKRLPQLLADTPGLAVVIDSFEPRTHRPKRRPKAYSSGKEKAHALKSQVGVDEESGRVVGVSDSVPGRWADTRSGGPEQAQVPSVRWRVLHRPREELGVGRWLDGSRTDRTMSWTSWSRRNRSHVTIRTDSSAISAPYHIRPPLQEDTNDTKERQESR